MRRLSNRESFLAVLSASEEQIEKQRHMEYVSRFLVHTYVPYDGRLDVEEFIDEGVVTLATAGETENAGATFTNTFDLLNEAFGENALRRFVNGGPTGRVGLVAFECIAVGIARNILHIRAQANPVGHVRERILALWESPEVGQFFAAGLRGTVRIQRTVPFGTRWFAE
jgi:hypothetical protein